MELHNPLGTAMGEAVAMAAVAVAAMATTHTAKALLAVAAVAAMGRRLYTEPLIHLLQEMKLLPR